MHNTFKINNFDLIRLAAALQVVVTHGMHHLGIKHGGPFFELVLRIFPGVPIFFFVSGFLISKSFEQNQNLRDYAQNRLLRIYPALFGCTAISVFIVYLTGYFAHCNVQAFDVVAFFVGQVTFVQFYNPSFMREFGTGVLNGSLWTIAVELQFYIVVPIMYWLSGAHRANTGNRAIIAMAVTFLAVHLGRNSLANTSQEYVWFKLLNVTFVPWFYMFLVGVLFQRKFTVLHDLLAGKAMLICVAYFLVASGAVTFLDASTGNALNPVLFLLLSALVFSAAYSRGELGRSLLRGNDISYGVYIYHMPIVNMLVVYGVTSHVGSLVIAVGGSVLAGVVSWRCLEKPVMKHKRRPLMRLEQAQSTGTSGL